MKINHLTESRKLPGQFGAAVMSPEQFTKLDQQGLDVDPNQEQEVAESGDNIHHQINRLGQMATDYYSRARATSNPIRKNHFIQMAQKFDNEKQNLIADANEQERDGNMVAQHDATPSGTWNRGGLEEGEVVAFPKKHRGDLEDTHSCVKCGGDLQSGTYMGHKVKVCIPCKQVYLPPNSGIDQQGNKIKEATELDAPQKEFGDQEFQDYMQRIVGAPDIDKKTGLPKKAKDKISKKTGEVVPGAEKYISGKTKSDKFKMPYMHRSSVVTYYDAGGKRFREEDVINALKVRPVKLLKQNEKMKHSNGAFEQFFNIGFAALTGIAVDESTGKLIIVNTCPGAGSCKVDCFAMKGGKVQFKNAWLSDGKILTYLLNDPKGFANQLNREIGKQAKDGQKGDKNFPNGWQVTIRWHDAGDFFSPEYLKLAFDIARANPTVKFYAYTKMAGAALAQKPDNFIINWSEGAHTSQEKQVKQNDPSLDVTKNSRIVPEKLFYDLLKKDAKGNLDKEGADADGAGGRWVMRDAAATKELKERLASFYNISANSILSYDEYTSKPKVAGMKYNVIVAPGEGDISANDPNVLSTLLLKH